VNNSGLNTGTANAFSEPEVANPSARPVMGPTLAVETAARSRRSGEHRTRFVMSADEFPTYKPSVFYFRKALRDSANCDHAVEIAVTVCTEFERLREWAIDQSVIPPSNIHVAADLLRAAIRESRSHGQVILLGLFVCHELEELKAVVRAVGLIPPKWIVAPEEAADKSWLVEESA
jgi:hypothetical protein